MSHERTRLAVSTRQIPTLYHTGEHNQFCIFMKGKWPALPLRTPPVLLWPQLQLGQMLLFTSKPDRWSVMVGAWRSSSRETLEWSLPQFIFVQAKRKKINQSSILERLWSHKTLLHKKFFFFYSSWGSWTKLILRKLLHCGTKKWFSSATLIGPLGRSQF